MVFAGCSLWLGLMHWYNDEHFCSYLHERVRVTQMARPVQGEGGLAICLLPLGEDIVSVSRLNPNLLCTIVLCVTNIRRQYEPK